MFIYNYITLVHFHDLKSFVTDQSITKIIQLTMMESLCKYLLDFNSIIVVILLNYKIIRQLKHIDIYFKISLYLW